MLIRRHRFTIEIEQTTLRIEQTSTSSVPDSPEPQSTTTPEASPEETPPTKIDGKLLEGPR